MRNPIVFPLVVFFFLVACSNEQNKSLKETRSVNQGNKDSLTLDLEKAPELATQFRTFRDDVFQNKKEDLKQFFDFPILNTYNEIWYHVTVGDPVTKDYPNDKVIPFSASDLDTYFPKLFPKLFIKCLLKIKSEELFEAGSFDTPFIMDGGTQHKIYATFDKEKGELNLNWYTEAPSTDDMDWPIEYNVNYLFKIDKSGYLKFVEIRLAG